MRFKPHVIRNILLAGGLNPRLFGGERVRTDDLLRARQTLSQLSYTPYCIPVGLSGIEPPTLRLSVVRSNHLSYRPWLIVLSGL